MANRPLRFRYKELPSLLQEFVRDISIDSVNDDDDQPRETLCEREYYRAFERLLRHRRYGDNETNITTATSSKDTVITPPLTAEQHRELAGFHLHRCVSSWIVDHEAHRKFAYYPSCAFPIGSTMEYSFFIQKWSKQVNYPHVRRLYNRGGDFENVLARVGKDLCPCNYLIAFNVLELVEYRHGGEDKTLCAIELENELMMRSDFFTKRKEYYQSFNKWLYDKFLDPLGEMHDVVRNGGGGAVTFYRHVAFKVRPRKRPVEQGVENDQTTSTTVETQGRRSQVSSANKKKSKRLESVRELSTRLLFGEVLPSDRQLLVRCEDYTSRLYSPVLKLTSCRHTEEDVSYEQRRCGDEAETEIRTCKKCGKVRAIAN